MAITDLLAQMGGVSSLAQQLGISESQASSGVEALLPAILGGFKKQALTAPAGVGGVVGLLGRLGGPGLAEAALGSQAAGAGAELMGKIFGSAEVTQAVTEHAAAKSGLEVSTITKMLPLLTMLVGGVLAKQATLAPAGGVKGMLGGLLGGKAAGPATTEAAPRVAELLGLASEGNPLDDILKSASQQSGSGGRCC